MLRTPACAVWVIAAAVATLASSARADDPPPEFPDAVACFAPLDDTALQPLERAAWTACEKWAWSCIRKGEEANFFAKSCVVPRQQDAKTLRKRFRLAPFVNPDQYKAANALSDKFLITILTNPDYVRQIQPVGVRIFGAYFADPVNLENLTTSNNLVLDAAIVRQGLRMTNFRSEKNLAFDGANIRGTIHLMRARIDGSLFMERSVLDNVDINDARIDSSFEATGALFNGELRMNRAHVEGKVILTKARLTSLIGWSAHIGSALEMRRADVRVGIDLTGSTVEGDVRLPEVSFGRRAVANSNYCDWDAGIETDHILSTLKQLVPPDKFAEVWKEVVEQRDFLDGKPAANACTNAEPGSQTEVVDNALLRDMKIKGTLCLVSVTGDIKGPDAAGGAHRSIKTISLDGTEAKSTVLSWDPSESLTEWRAMNFKTEYLLVNLHSQPMRHYVDNLDLRLITLLKQDRASANAPEPKISDEHLVKRKCDITPGLETTDDAGNRETQDRIIKFFNADKSGSAQPFASVVASLNSSGVNTVHLRKALSALKYRNACTSSEFSKALRDRPWSSFKDAWLVALDKRPATVGAAHFWASEVRNIGFDAGCAAWLFVHKNTVSYGHEPLRLAFWIIAAIIVFWLLLRFDSRGGGFVERKRFSIVYALDNLIPLKQYRVEPQLADELPNSGFLKGYRFFHRLLGLFFAVMIFFYVYKAST